LAAGLAAAGLAGAAAGLVAAGFLAAAAGAAGLAVFLSLALSLPASSRIKLFL